MWIQHFTSLQFLTYCAFAAVVLLALLRFLPGAAPPVRTEPYSDQELHAHDAKLAKYVLAGALFLVLGAVHTTVKNLPWPAEWLARGGYGGHLVRDLSNTHLIIVGGGTLIATGLCWYALPRIVGRPLASNGLAQAAFWCTAGGLVVFYVALVGNGIAISQLVQHGWEYRAAKAHMGKWYSAPVGMGAGVMGVGYWCFAANVLLTVFQSRLVRVAKPHGHLGKYLVTGALALTVGTVQGVIQVQPSNADWLYTAGHAGEWIDPISHAHINLVTGLTMLVAGSFFLLVPALGGRAPAREVADACFYALLFASLSFYFATLFLGLHEGRLVVNAHLTPEEAEQATRVHPFLIMTAGVAMFAAFWFLLAVVVRSLRGARGPLRALVLAGCGALALGTLQGPVQAVPAVNELLDRGGDAGDLVVNLHAQLNMVGGLLMILAALALAVLARLGATLPARAARGTLYGVPAGMLVYYAGGIAFAALEARRVSGGGSFGSAVTAFEPWEALVLVPAGAAVLVGFSSFAVGVWGATALQRAAAREAIRLAPGRFTGPIPKRVQRRRPIALAGYELPMGLMGFPGIGWIFAGFPFTGTLLLLGGPAMAWAVVPIAFSPYGEGPLVSLGWKVEFVWLAGSSLVSSAALYRAHARRRARLDGRPPGGLRLRRRRKTLARTRARIAVTLGIVALVLVSLPFVPAVAGVGSSSVRYSYQPGFTPEITGPFLRTSRGTVKLFAWSDPQWPPPQDALRLHADEVDAFVFRAAAVDRPAAYALFDVDRRTRVPLVVRAVTPKSLTLAPARPLAAGRYAFVPTHEGMFGGKDFAYLEVVAPGAPVTTIYANGTRAVPAVAEALPPIAATLVALLFALMLLRSFLRRPAGQTALWGAGFLLFAVAAACETTAQRTGWTPGSSAPTTWRAGCSPSPCSAPAPRGCSCPPGRATRCSARSASRSSRPPRRSRSLLSTRRRSRARSPSGRRRTPCWAGMRRSGRSASTSTGRRSCSAARSGRSRAAAGWPRTPGSRRARRRSPSQPASPGRTPTRSSTSVSCSGSR